MENKTQDFSAIDLIDFIWKYKKVFVIIGIAAAIISSIVSLLMEERYQSTVTLYPTKASAVTFSEVITEDQSVSKFGEEEEAEQMLQILGSEPIRNNVISTFNLMKHYEIEDDDRFKNTTLAKTYSDFINFERNNKGAVLIKVMDKSPDTAALIANHIAGLFDSIKNNMIHQRAYPDFEIKKRKLLKLQNEMIMLMDTMSNLTSIGVVTNEAYQGLTEAMLNAKDQEMREKYLKKIEMTEKYGSVLHSFQVKVEYLAERISTMSASYEQAETDANSSISHKFVVETASPSEKKAYPIRWLIVLVSTVITVFLTFILLLFTEKIKELKAK
jgi:uncharacterized protein involved in exopolysaccharide biosynthesis